MYLHRMFDHLQIDTNTSLLIILPNLQLVPGHQELLILLDWTEQYWDVFQDSTELNSLAQFVASSFGHHHLNPDKQSFHFRLQFYQLCVQLKLSLRMDL